MTPSVDLSPPRRPLFFPVVIATVFLTIIGMTGGFMLGQRHRRNTAAVQQTTQPTVAPTTSSLPASPGVNLCPEEARQTSAALGYSPTLWQVMKIETENGTTVWICRDDTGGLFYQSKTGGLDAALIQNKNGLFLPNVQHGEDSERYIAQATNRNTFVVDRQQLEIDFADGRKSQISKVVASE